MSYRRRGRQRPRISVEPKRRYSDGRDASELVSAYGMTPDPWQALVLEAWLGRDEFDKFTATTCGLSVPRQNGKNAIIEMYELYHLVAIGSAILHTAHEVRTARKSFLRLAGFFTQPDKYPELAEMVLQVRRTNGQEAILLNNGGQIEFSARSKGAARGFTVDCVVFDEAAFLTDEQLEAIMSTMAAAPKGNRQLVYTGTPPSPTMPCEVYGRVRDTALKGTDPRLCWHEWSVQDIPEATTFKGFVKACYDANPAMGIRLDESFTESEYNSLSPDGFARERLGYWAASTHTALITPEEWARGAVSPSKVPNEGKVAYGVKFSPDGAYVALCVAFKPDNGTPHVEIIRHESMREGTSWIADWLVQRKNKASVMVIDGKSHADSLVAQLRENDVPRLAIITPRTGDVVAAATRFYNAVKENRVTHVKKGQKPLELSILQATKRPIGNNGGWGWGNPDDAGAAAPVEAASLAYWGVMTTNRDPRRKAVVW